MHKNNKTKKHRTKIKGGKYPPMMIFIDLVDFYDLI